MNELGTQHGKGALGWIRVLGWQIVALVLVILVGISMFRVCDSLSRALDSEARLTEDLSKCTSFLKDCLPTASAQKIRGLFERAIELGVREAHKELDRELKEKPGDFSPEARPPSTP